MQIPRVYFDSQWQKNTAVFDAILLHFGVDRIEFGLLGFFVGLAWPNNGPKTIEEILDDMGVDLFFDHEQEQVFREKIESMRMQKN